MLLLTAATTGQQQEKQERTLNLVERYDRAVNKIERIDSRINKCRHARKAVAYYRAKTYDYQDRRASARSSKSPMARGKSCHWAKYAASVWVARARAAKDAYTKWWKERGSVIRLLDRIVSGTPMAGTGSILEKYGRQYGVSPFFMVAVAATESSIGYAACGPGGFNAWGLGNCGTAWSVPAFSSWNEAIAYYAKFLTRWVGHTTPYSFRGYAACDECWGRKVSSYMQSFGVEPITRYP